MLVSFHLGKREVLFHVLFPYHKAERVPALTRDRRACRNQTLLAAQPLDGKPETPVTVEKAGPEVPS